MNDVTEDTSPRAPRISVKAPINLRAPTLPSGLRAGRSTSADRACSSRWTPPRRKWATTSSSSSACRAAHSRDRRYELLPDLYCQGRVVRTHVGEEGVPIVAASIRRQWLPQPETRLSCSFDLGRGSSSSPGSSWFSTTYDASSTRLPTFSFLEDAAQVILHRLLAEAELPRNVLLLLAPRPTPATMSISRCVRPPGNWSDLPGAFSEATRSPTSSRPIQYSPRITCLMHLHSSSLALCFSKHAARAPDQRIPRVARSIAAVTTTVRVSSFSASRR